MGNARIPALIAVLLILFLRLDSMRAQDTAIVSATEAPPNGVWVDSLDLGKIGASWLRAVGGKSVRNNPISLDDVVYPHGVGTVAMSEVTIDLKPEAVTKLSRRLRG
jgi:NPCBM/NEW2 domain